MGSESHRLQCRMECLSLRRTIRSDAVMVVVWWSGWRNSRGIDWAGDTIKDSTPILTRGIELAGDKMLHVALIWRETG